jgi:hypothetical protein
MNYELKAGDIVMIEETWYRFRAAYLGEHAPYPRSKTDGWYVYWLYDTAVDPVTGIRPSAGGWKPVRAIHKVADRVHQLIRNEDKA